MTAGVAGTLLALGLVAAVVVSSGIYSVAASAGHWDVTRWFLEFALRRSIATHSALIEVPPLRDPDLIRLGAAHFRIGCAPCHGAPGAPENPVTERMLPAPPPLSETVPSWSAEELFWIVDNGLKYTGMPAWAARDRGDEVWAVVAFLQQLPAMDAGEYHALSTGNAARQGHGQMTAAPFSVGNPPAETALCARCHGSEASPPGNRLVPRLAGQSPDYLAHALRNYAEARRASGIMQTVAAGLDEAAIGRIAEHYAAMPVTRGQPAPVAAGPEAIARGRVIATEGIRDAGIPPCLACHDGTSAATFPLLAGQHATYLAGQLRLWQNGLRDRTAQGAIMAQIARRLTAQQIADVTAYLEGLGAARGDGIVSPENTL